MTIAAVASVDFLDVLENNAGVALADDLSDGAAIEQHVAAPSLAPVA